MPNLDQSWPGLANVVLTKGAHIAGTGGFCFSEAISQHAFATKGEDYDVGKISLILRQTGQRINDAVSDSIRQTLKVSIQAVVDSSGADNALEIRRAYKMVDGEVRVFFPAWLDFVGYQSFATQLRNLPEIKTASQAASARVTLRPYRIILKQALSSKQAVVGPPTSYGYRAYRSIIATAGQAYLLSSDLPAEYLIRRSDSEQGNVDETTANAVFGADANGAGGFYDVLGLLAVGSFRQAVATT